MTLGSIILIGFIIIGVVIVGKIICACVEDYQNSGSSFKTKRTKRDMYAENTRLNLDAEKAMSDMLREAFHRNDYHDLD